MANSIALAQNFLGVLDAVYKRESLTGLLDAAPGTVDFVGANTCKVYKLSMDGLGDYSRSSGYPHGDVTGAWETLTLSKDRGAELGVDRFDNEESKNMADRLKVICEIIPSFCLQGMDRTMNLFNGK